MTEVLMSMVECRVYHDLVYQVQEKGGDTMSHEQRCIVSEKHGSYYFNTRLCHSKNGRLYSFLNLLQPKG